MRLVDFVVEEEDRNLLIEITDPGWYIPRKKEGEHLKKLMSEINEEFVPKVRDSYCYLHLMKKDAKPFLYVVVLGIDNFEKKDEFSLAVFKEKLMARIRQEGREPWIRHYIADCIVTTPANWSRLFQYPLTRK